MRAVGLGCHDDRLYVDLRPLLPGYERVYVMAWNSDDTDYCADVMKMARNMVEGRLASLVVTCLTCPSMLTALVT